MATQFSRTWWGKQFIAALENITDEGRLSRGRSYARGSKVKTFQIQDGTAIAHVRGSVNPYFGVYTEPTYTTIVEIQPISVSKWKAAISHIASKASFISRLLLNEIPDNIEDAFAPMGLHLLPNTEADFKTSCTCPDYSNPCKHIAGVYYLLAAQLDEDPFLLFELRGLSRETLKQELARSPLGQALSTELDAQTIDPRVATAYYSPHQAIDLPADLSLRDFWQGAKRLPKLEPVLQTGVPAVLIKKQGDYPAFWHKDQSFIEAMEELYERVRTKHKF
jgi:uncharacterized Zn finger protein